MNRPPVVILAPWGNPFNWGSVKYKIVHVEKSSSYCESRSISSLDLITRYYREEGFNPWVLVLIQESLLAAKPREREDCVALDNNVDEEVYTRLVGELEKCIDKYIGSETGIKRNSSKLEVKAMPSTGEYSVGEKDSRVRWRIAGDLLVSGKANPFDHYYTNALIAITRFLLDASKDARDNRVRVVLDLTHGINYAGHAFYRASLLAIRVYSVIMGVNVDIEVYNSEPYSRDVEELGIHRIRREVITPKKAAGRLIYTFINHDPERLRSSFYKPLVMSKDMDPEKKGELGKEQNEKLLEVIGWLFRGEETDTRELAYIVTAAPFFGAPLLVLQAGHWISESHIEPRDSLESFLDYLFGFIHKSDLFHVTHNNKGIVITYTSVLNRALVSSIVSGIALAGFVLNSYKDFCSGNECCTRLNNGSRRICVNVSCLAKRENNDYVIGKYIVGPVQYVVENELSCLKAGSRCKGNPLAGIIEGIKENEHVENQCSDISSIDVRVFQAHAGLNRNVIEVRMINGEPCIKYCNGKCVDKGLARVSKDLLSKLYKALREEAKIDVK